MNAQQGGVLNTAQIQANGWGAGEMLASTGYPPGVMSTDTFDGSPPVPFAEPVDFLRAEKASYQRGDFTTPASIDPADINREIYLLNARTHATSSYSPSGIINENGKNYYLTMRDENGLGIYQSGDVTTATSIINQTGDALRNSGISSQLRGALSERYETGGRGPGTVSNGVGDNGGVSYGSYQLASRMGRPQDFLLQDGQQWAAQFGDANPTIRNGEFAQIWRRIAQEEPVTFFAAQHAYIERTHYDVSVERIQRQTGVDINEQHAAVQDVVWSTAVQHGPTNSVVVRAIGSMGNVSQDSPDYSQQLINSIYDERSRIRPDGNLVYFSRSSQNQQAGVASRLANERNDALQMLNRGRLP